MYKFTFSLAIVFNLFLMLGTASSTIIHVPGDYPTIQEGINAAVAGDTVLVSEGTYVENINFNGKAILVASNYIMNGNISTISATIIDGNESGRVVTFNSGEDSTSKIVGFTLQNGMGGNGGGIYCSGSSPLIDHLIIQNNSAQFGGGGIACQFNSNPIITNTWITGNVAEHGGGIWTAGSNPVIGTPESRCNIYNNIATNECGLGAELRVQDSQILTVHADTFSVLNPDEGLIYPIDRFNLNINTAYFSSIAADVYVSPSGDNSNDGLSPATPFRNVWYAILRVVSSPVDTFKINILPGIYSPSLTGERTLHPKSYVSLVGEDSSTTIIDGEGEMCLIYCYQDNQLTISDLTLKNGNAFQGAGIYCEDSSPTISRNIIKDNAEGGIYCVDNSSPIVINNQIMENFSYGIHFTNQSNGLISNNYIHGNMGGGIICSDNSNPDIIDNAITSDANGWGTGISCQQNSSPMIISNNISGNSSSSGGGISCNGFSNPTIVNNTITNNTAGLGGGIYCDGSSPVIDDNVISNNTTLGVAGAFGGGIFCKNSNPTITKNQITGNSSIGNIESVSTVAKGGGIYLENSNPVIGGSMGNGNLFQDNIALTGADLYIEGAQNIINAQYNTFNIYPLSTYYVRPIDDFDLSNGTGINQPIIQDVYVSPLGSNQNDGLTPQTPFLNVQFALSRLLPSPLNMLNIHLAPGTYSPSSTNEMFPLSMLSYVSLQGSGSNSSILDAEYTNRVIYCLEVDSLTISGLKITGGRAASGGGIYCETSNPIIWRNTITADSADWGGGIYCTVNANPVIANNIITENKTIGFPYWAKLGGGIFVNDNSSPRIINNLITYNNSQNWGGGIACNNNSHPMIINNTISRNEAGKEGGGVVCWNNSNPTIENTIVWDNAAPIDPSINIFSSLPIVTYSDVQGGWSGTGNIDVDPLFADTLVFYLSSGSPCIDAGNADSSFNDPEDPLNPGFALFPAMGSLRNDMGAYGGPGAMMQLPVGVKESELESRFPTKFVLYQNYPNPFNPSTTINYSIPEISFVTVKIYDVLGSEIATLVNEEKPIGSYEVEFDATTLPSGVYFYKLQAGDPSTGSGQGFVETKKMVLLR